MTWSLSMKRAGTNINAQLNNLKGTMYVRKNSRNLILCKLRRILNIYYLKINQE